jgi:hypothetical protein
MWDEPSVAELFNCRLAELELLQETFNFEMNNICFIFGWWVAPFVNRFLTAKTLPFLKSFAKFLIKR